MAKHILKKISVLVASLGLWGFFYNPTKAELDQSSSSCEQALSLAESQAGFPQGLLQAVALTESEYKDNHSGKIVAWPFTVTIAGEGHYFSNLSEAVNAVEQALIDQTNNIDIGCMQINYNYHGIAFSSIEQMFNPVDNVAYAASFLRQLYRRHGNWLQALSFYHSSDDTRGTQYQAKVLTKWTNLRSDIFDQPQTTPDEKITMLPALTAVDEPVIQIQPLKTMVGGYRDAYLDQSLAQIKARKQALTPVSE